MQIERVLMVEEMIGRGVNGDPCRRKLNFYRDSDLSFLCSYDDWAEQERTQIIQDQLKPSNPTT